MAPVLVISINFAQPEIRDPQVAVPINENVFWFQISVEYSIFVHVIECKHDLSCVKLGSPLIKLPLERQMIEEFATVDKLHYHVQIVCVLERIFQLHNERMLNSL